MQYVLPNGQRIFFVGRYSSGSPATGSQRVHQLEQEKLVREAFAEE